MNNTHPNYAYYTGGLLQILEKVIFDENFAALTTWKDRRDYIDAKVAEAKANAIEYENERLALQDQIDKL